MSFLRSPLLAAAVGIVLPIGETARRWGTGGSFIWWLDDYLIGAFLLYGAWRCGRDVEAGQRILAAAWAFTCGIGYMSFFGHLERLSEPARGHIPHLALVWIIGLGWALAIFAMFATLRPLPQKTAYR